MKQISAVIITHNEEKAIIDCLDSVRSVVDEIVVLDSFSTDNTLAKCKQYGAKVAQQAFKGYGPQKQDAVSRASYPWILQIDADEIVTPALAQEIADWKTMSDDEYAGYDIPFRLFFMGRRMRFGGCGRERHVRLFLKDKATYGNKPIHEGIRVTGAIGTFNHPIHHFSYASIEEYIDIGNTYTSLIAREKFAAGARFHVWQLLRLPYEFKARYFLKLGFLDGLPGFMYALLSSYYALMKHVKLYELQLTANSKHEYRNPKEIRSTK